MDYEVFLVSSMREAHVHGHRGKDTIVHGFDQASRVVVAAAVIMVSVFSGFIFSDDPTIKQFGFALAAGILIDAFLVRMTLVPALMALLGERAWWLPRWLDRLLPNLDVEGDRLKQHLEADRDEQGVRGTARGTQRIDVEAAGAFQALGVSGERMTAHSAIQHVRQGEKQMIYQIPVSRKGLQENRFQFTVDGRAAYDIPLPRYSPVASAEALEDGKVLSAVLLACDSDEARSVIEGLDVDQLEAFVEAWRAAGAGSGTGEAARTPATLPGSLS
jgi:RND superfamily putative drug exporter